MNVETRCQKLIGCIPMLASMEPRFDERGNLRATRPERPATPTLQWSHVSMNVETLAVFSKGHIISTASMEPRFDERGNSTRFRGLSATLISFNGATFR